MHHAGQTARRFLEHARAQVAALIGATPAQTVFTSGGTEANNLSIFGAVRSRPGRRRIVSSAIEHSSILAPLARLEAEGFEVSKIAPDREGRLDPAWIVSLLDENTALVTLGLANSEVGTIQNLAPVTRPVRAAGAIFHIDAAQAIGRIPVDVSQLGLRSDDRQRPQAWRARRHRRVVRAQSVRASTDCSSAVRRSAACAPGLPIFSGAVGFGAAAAVIRNECEEESRRMAELGGILLDRPERW